MKSKQVTILSAPINTVELHYKRPLIEKLVHITSADEADAYVRRHINSQRLDLKEFFWVVLLSNANQALGFAEIGSGTDKGVRVSIREVFQLALISNASAVIIAHNHPSGKLTSSISDKTLTQEVKKIADVLSIKLVDHLIITSESYFSFKEGGLL